MNHRLLTASGNEQPVESCDLRRDGATSPSRKCGDQSFPRDELTDAPYVEAGKHALVSPQAGPSPGTLTATMQ